MYTLKIATKAQAELLENILCRVYNQKVQQMNEVEGRQAYDNINQSFQELSIFQDLSILHDDIHALVRNIEEKRTHLLTPDETFKSSPLFDKTDTSEALKSTHLPEGSPKFQLVLDLLNRYDNLYHSVIGVLATSDDYLAVDKTKRELFEAKNFISSFIQ